MFLAEPAGYVRVFADEGEQMARLLARLSFQKPATAAYLRTLLEAGHSVTVLTRSRVAVQDGVDRRVEFVEWDAGSPGPWERTIEGALRTLLADRTSFVIAHRLSTIRDADLIVVLEHGQVIEQGSHEELLARRGLYTSLYGDWAAA